MDTYIDQCNWLKQCMKYNSTSVNTKCRVYMLIYAMVAGLLDMHIGKYVIYRIQKNITPCEDNICEIYPVSFISIDSIELDSFDRHECICMPHKLETYPGEWANYCQLHISKERIHGTFKCSSHDLDPIVFVPYPIDAATKSKQTMHQYADEYLSD